MTMRVRISSLVLVSIVTVAIGGVGAQQGPPAQLPPPPDVAAAPPDAIVTPSGLASKVLTPGRGTERPTAASTIRVHYSGWTTDGQMFDSSVVRGEPSSFGVTRVIRGWTEGVQLMVKGEKRRFWIPAGLAYGDNPRPGAPRGLLVFDVELLEITTPADAAGLLAGYGTHKTMTAASPYKLIPWQSIGPSNHTGRMTSVAVADVGGVRSIYVGAATGGVWKSSNRGLTWRPIFEHEASASIGDVAVAPSNPSIVWVGTGVGIYKSINAGRTWQHMGLTDAGAISRVVVHPTNPSIVFVAALGHEWTPNDVRGVFKTTDGGKTWTKVLYRTPTTSAADLAMDPKDPNTLYASMWPRARRKWSEPRMEPNSPEGGVWKTTDGGSTWVPANSGLPELKPIAAAGPGINRIWVDPVNPKVIYTAHDQGFAMSVDGGRTRRQATGIRGSQFQNVELDMARPFRASGWIQGVGTFRATMTAGPGRGAFTPRAWQSVPAVDRTTPAEAGLRSNTMAPVVPSPFDGNTVYAGHQFVYRSRDRGTTWERISEDLTDNNPRQMGVNPSAIPYQTITHIAESPLTRGLIYAGTDDGNLHVTRDDGRTWTNIGRNLPMAMKKWVSRIVPSKYDAATVWLAQRGREDDDFAPYLWKSTDYGTTWTSVVGNIPSGSINVIREDPSVAGLLYAGNDFGAYVTKDAGRSWHVLGGNLPSVQVSDLQIHPRDHLIVIATYGRGMWVMDGRRVRAVK